MKRPSSTTLSFLFALVLLVSCAQSRVSVPMPSLRGTKQPASTRTNLQGWVYTDAKLGFQLTVPLTWQAQPQSGSQFSPNTAAVTFTYDEQSTHAIILIGVFHRSMMPAAFAQRGKPTIHIGPYPAFVADRSLLEGRAPCLVRIFLAHDDYVLADWCAPNAFAFRVQFERVLATYQPASPTFVPGALTAAPSPQTCTDMQHLLGYADVLWGRQLATPMSAGWREMGTGASICSNEGSSDWYLFQCTELANRFLYERWALPHIPGNAARYYDYYQGGVFQPGTIRTFPAGSYQLSDDASQGKSTFRPVAGDLLIFQDVNNPQVGWTSGLTNSPGHIAVIVGVDNAFVYIAQENYSDMQYFLALPIHKVASGYEITDLSGWSQRIVRGWIHFTVNGGPQPLS
jgi:hypothetical protein